MEEEEEILVVSDSSNNSLFGSVHVNEEEEVFDLTKPVKKRKRKNIMKLKSLRKKKNRMKMKDLNENFRILGIKNCLLVAQNENPLIKFTLEVENISTHKHFEISTTNKVLKLYEPAMLAEFYEQRITIHMNKDGNLSN